MLLDVVLVLAALSTGLVSGLLLAFALLAMPGLGSMEDRAFLRGFQVVDRVIQDGHPVFLLLWGGSVIAVVAAALIGIGQLQGTSRAVVVVASALWLLGVQLPTAVVNVPLNNRLQALDVHDATADEVAAARSSFEARWNRWNVVRTVVGVFVSTALLVVLLLR